MEVMSLMVFIYTALNSNVKTLFVEPKSTRHRTAAGVDIQTRIVLPHSESTEVITPEYYATNGILAEYKRSLS